jgi:hypothetical protein
MSPDTVRPWAAHCLAKNPWSCAAGKPAGVLVWRWPS